MTSGTLAPGGVPSSSQTVVPYAGRGFLGPSVPFFDAPIGVKGDSQARSLSFYHLLMTDGYLAPPPSPD